MSEEMIKNLIARLNHNCSNACLNNASSCICTVNDIKDLIHLYNKEKEKNKELEEYDYRKIKLDEKYKISSIHFTKEQLNLMNLGIALYVGIPKLLADKEDEETDI